MDYPVHARYSRLRNYNKRDKLHHEWYALVHARDADINSADDAIEDADEVERVIDAIYAKYDPQIDALRLLEFALEYPEPRDAWFVSTFCAGFADGTTSISHKQADIFSRHCEEDRETWRSGKSYCRVSGRLVSLTVINRARYVAFTPLPQF